MNQFKRAQIIMLESYTLSNITLFDKLYYNKQLYDPSSANNQHLYIISDDEIKEGDWIYNSNSLRIYKSDGRDNGASKNWKHRIIATTDTSLNTQNINNDTKSIVIYPQPSQQFIEKYIECYNKGEIITDVLVGYEEYILQHLRKPQENLFRLKINPKENTITIKKVKDK